VLKDLIKKWFTYQKYVIYLYGASKKIIYTQFQIHVKKT